MTGLEGTPGYSVPLRHTTGFEGVPRRTTVYLFFLAGSDSQTYDTECVVALRKPWHGRFRSGTGLEGEGEGFRTPTLGQ